jgi:hypothetical protein
MDRTKDLVDDLVFRWDAPYILGPVARLLLDCGVDVSRRDSKKALRASVRRLLRVAATEARLPVSLAEKHVGSVVRTFVG